MSETQDTLTRTRIASELDKNFIVEAAAGTGKTTCLVSRMVALIETGTCQIDQLAAVTFTRKAAAELRERFQAALQKRATTLQTGDAEKCKRLKSASDRVDLAFVGTIHSFCAALLRERPIEFAVDPAFRELDEKDDYLLREQAWHENIADLIASGDPLLDQLRDLDIDRAQLKTCFSHFIEHRDIEHWPVKLPPEIDIEALQQHTRQYISEIKDLLKTFPKQLDDLVDRYWQISRASSRGFRTLGDFFSLLERFTSKKKGVQKDWASVPGGSKELCKQHNARWEQFRTSVALPGIEYWTRYRYQFVVRFLRRAVSIYEQLKQASGGLDFQDLLLTVARGLKTQPHLRTYFQSRYSTVLVDEFQDTDPLQSQMLLFLTASDPAQTDWRQCVPKPGALFLVGDPKQSIYRFRRGDILTYNQVKEIVCTHGGEVLPLVKNFRSRVELREWNNRIYRDKFGKQATAYSPAAEDMVQGREDSLHPQAAHKKLCGPYRLELPTDYNVADVRKLEAESIARYIRHAIDTGVEVFRTQEEELRGRKTQVEPRDFLIIPWGKKSMNDYTDALERYRIPYQVSGGNPLTNNSHLNSLADCLRAIDDPSNPVHYLSVLRRFFGFSDRELFLLRQANGSFNYNHPIPDGLSAELKEKFQSVAQRFQNYQAWMRSMSYATAACQIADDLGVIAAAAATDEGDMQAGGLFKVIEWLRSQSWDFDSATDMIECLENVLTTDDADVCPALRSTGNVVRLMNLHKAKGLQAPVVFLAGAVSRYRGKAGCHIDRSAEVPVGYMGIVVDISEWHKKEVATPEDWSEHQAEEQRFLDAEHDRLLYVATTRAECATIVSVYDNKTNWSSLHPYLEDSPLLQIPGVDTAGASDQPVASDSVSLDDIQAKWKVALTPGYSITTAKTLGLKGRSRPDWEASGDYGHQWGSVIHELLEVCHKSTGFDPHPAELHPTALRLAQEYGVATDRVDELVATVRSVEASEIWKRALEAKRCYSELPFETTVLDDEGRPQLLRGVIDLIFEEQDGWVIVDYKTDDITNANIREAVRYYRSQLERYSHHWTSITSYQVKEIGLYFTKLNQYEAIV